MTTVTALEAKNRFGKLLEMAQRGPVTITKNGRESAVIMSPETFQQFDKIDQLNRQRFIRSMAAASREAEKNGITDDIVEELLRDNS